MLARAGRLIVRRWGAFRRRLASSLGRLSRSLDPRSRRLQARLNTPQMRELVRKAAEIEPLVARVPSRRKITRPPRPHDARALFRYGERLRRAVGDAPVEDIILVPHLRHLSGASRVAAALSAALAELHAGSRLLLVTTDRDEKVTRADLPAGVEILPFASIVPTSLKPNFRQRLLVDLLGGTRTRRVFNINSRLGWDVYLLYGRALATFTSLHAYLFCWDLDERGNRVGYPVDCLPEAFPALSGVFTDSEALRNELVHRFCLPRKLSERLHTLPTPPEDASRDHGDTFRRRRERGEPLRGLWAGRLDRQKRPDIAIEAMRQLPDVRLDIYGARVFGGAQLNRLRLPRNVTLRKPYCDFAEVPIDEYDFLLHTAEWEGLPNVVIAAAACGMPIVTSPVGGIPELVDETTGWPVQDHGDPAAFARRIRELAETPPDAVEERTRRLRKRTLQRHSPDRYRELLTAALDA